MPPEVTPTQYSHPRTPLLSRASPEPRLNRNPHHKQQRMKLTKKKIIPTLVLILCSASLFRFLNVTMIVTFSVSPPSAALHSPSMDSSSLTEKESLFLLQLLSQRVPCNILVFGNSHQYSSIASMNSGGVTIFLEDNNASKSNSSSHIIHKIIYSTAASEAFQLLRDARGNPDCFFRHRKESKCKLGVANLPPEVYETRWDVVVVDGPDGGAPDSPGRMSSIYTAGILARRGSNTTSHVVVHDVDRMIEKWFSWEFLCEENLVSSKGRFWHFQIVGAINATTFCTP